VNKLLARLRFIGTLMLLPDELYANISLDCSVSYASQISSLIISQCIRNKKAQQYYF